jgi:hypothetical protein
MVKMVHLEKERKLAPVSRERAIRNGPEITVALYRPMAGKDAELSQLIAEHIPVLRKLELITERPSVLFKSNNGTYIEIFEWRAADSAFKAEQHPEVAQIWEAMAKIAELPTIGSLEESKFHFPQFEPVQA